ncbi:MAG TPA: hypothetical protein VF756_07315 [Thermoanaerobaculia bacterium]
MKKIFLFGLGVLFALSATAAPARDPRGFLYGRITTTGGSVYEGRLRWNNKEEAFWGDFFNAGKEDLPYLKYAPQRERRRDSIEIFGIRIGISDEDDGSRQLGARFGDLRHIEVERRNDATVVFKSGARYEVSGGSNDLDSDTEITVWDRKAGETRLRWNKIRTIDFLPTPDNLAVPAFRLRGTVDTENGTFRGYIQWDQDECLSSDELDGNTQDGEVSLPMGEIRSIERQGRDSSKVVLRTGRTLVLKGTNDVDSSNRGIYVSDSRFGRVLVNWETFRRIDFDPPGDSGPAYTDFRPGRPLFGKVSTAQGKTYRGRLVYDLDETETMDLLDGRRGGVEYSIPFARIAFLLPERTDSSRVVLRNGQELRLEDSVDVGRENAGVLVFEPGRKEPRYFPWQDIRRIDFEAR